jgi:ribonuclease PH
MDLQPTNFKLNVAPYASGSVLVSIGNTRVICGVTIEKALLRWLNEQSVTGTQRASWRIFATESRNEANASNWLRIPLRPPL